MYKLKCLIPALLLPGLLLLLSCGGKEKPVKKGAETVPLGQILPAGRTVNAKLDEFSIPLEGIAEVERSGGYYPALAFTESGLRERAGDYAGAVIAAYKGLSFRYGYGEISGEELGEALGRAFAAFENSGPENQSERDAALAAIRGIGAFSAGLWGEAQAFLGGLLSDDEEPDSFLRWMLLVCSLETGGSASKRSDRSAYGAIRARFNSFPEYWYRGARAYNAVSPSRGSGVPAGENIAGIYAEQCINLSPSGPFAGESRDIIAGGLGLSDAGGAIRSKTEIDETVRLSVSAENPVLLGGLFPLITLPDNSYTNYAVGLLKNLGSVPAFRNYFEQEAAQSGGRLAERLRYISRG